MTEGRNRIDQGRIQLTNTTRMGGMEMRRVLFRTFLAVALTTATKASAIEAQHGTHIGVRGGVSVATASFDVDTFDEDNRTGFVGGPFVDFDFGALGFQVAGLYNSKGVDTSLGELDLKYIELPAVVKLGIPLPAFKPSIFGGASIAFRTGCELDGVDCSDAFQSTDFLGVVGADAAIYLGEISLWADARYNVGLTDVDADDIFGDLKNRNWNLTAGIGFKP